MRLQYIDTSIYFDVEIQAIKPNVLQVTGNGLPMEETGFILLDDEDNVYDYTAYKTLYRAITGGFQYSNDGETWVEPTKTVTVSIDWRDDDNILKLRPSSVKVSVFDNEQSIGSVTLNEKNGWTKVYDNVPETHIYTVTANDIAQYQKEINETTIVYTVDQPYEPTIEEQLAELLDVVAELDERVYALEEK